MRPPVHAPARKSHLIPCPRCGEANGVTAISCWKCDLQLMPEALMGPRPGTAVVHVQPLHDDAPVVDAEVSPAMLEQIRTGGRGHEGPHTLPPFAAAPGAQTANDPLFARPGGSKLPKVTLGVAVVTLIVAMLWPLSPPVEQRPAEVAATPAVALPEAAPIQPVAAVPKTNQTIAPPPPKPTAADRERAARAAQEAVLPTSTTAVVAAPVKPPVPRNAVQRNANSARVAAAPPQPADVSRPDFNAAPRPAPVAGPCTPQIAALALCTLESK